MTIWQIIMVVLWAMNLGIDLVKHGEYKPRQKYNFFATLIATGIEALILYYGGFFG